MFYKALLILPYIAAEGYLLLKILVIRLTKANRISSFYFHLFG